MNKLIRIILNQPYYTPNGFIMRLMIALSLFSTFYVLTVFRNIFGSDLTVSDSVGKIDTIQQFNESGRLVIYDTVKTTEQMVSKLNDPISKLLQSRTIPTADWGLRHSALTAKLMFDQKAVSVTNFYYHGYIEGGHCFHLLTQLNMKSPASRYHISGETFLPTVTAYVYGRNIDPELERRLNLVLNTYIEYGIEDYKSLVKPRIAFRQITNSDDAYLCTQKKEVEEQSYPESLSIKALDKTMKIGVVVLILATAILLIEIVGYRIMKWFELKKLDESRKIGTRTNNSVSYQEKMFHNRWSHCQHMGTNINPTAQFGRYKLRYDENNECRFRWKPAHVEIIKLKSGKRFNAHSQFKIRNESKQFDFGSYFMD